MPRTLLSAPPTERVGRYPKHTFQIKERPFVAQPFMIAPVLPGETLENLFFEARCVTDPIKNPIIGWKKEFHFFYVRITDLLNDTIRDMFVDPTNTDLTATLGVASTVQQFYQAKGGIDYAFRAYKRVIETFFRDQDEAWNVVTDGAGSNALAVVQNREIGWMDSLTDKDDVPLGADPNTATNAADLEALQMAWEQLRAMGVANLTYEDFLRSYGISIPNKDENKPEWIARFTDFQYPSNTITQGTGATASAVSWVFRNGNKDRKFFKEPGFLIGISITRPKIYYAGSYGNLAGFLSRAWDWMPNYLWGQENQAMTTLKKFAAGTGPLGDRLTAGNEDAYWVDMRDLFVHGDQWQNVVANADGADPVITGANHLYSGPTQTAIATRKYVSSTFMDALFVTAGGTTRSDGYVSLNIKGKVVDYTAAQIADA